MLSETQLQRLATVPFFAHIPADLLSDLVKGAMTTTYPHAGLLFNHNDPADNIYVLLEGLVTISLYHEDGSQAVIKTVNPLRTFAEAAAFLTGFYPATAEYSGGSKIIAIPIARFLDTLASSPQTAFAILGSLALRERELSSQLDALKLHNPSQRLLRYLLHHIPKEETGRYTLTWPLDKGMIAKNLGITAESLSRLLARFSRYGITNTRKDVHIANVSELRAFLDSSTPKTGLV